MRKRTSKRPDVFKAWGIYIGNSKHDKPDNRLRLTGRYWYFGNESRPVPVHLEGCQVALFTTRVLARWALQNFVSKDIFPRAKVVRLEVTIRDTGTN